MSRRITKGKRRALREAARHMFVQAVQQRVNAAIQELYANSAAGYFAVTASHRIASKAIMETWTEAVGKIPAAPPPPRYCAQDVLDLANRWGAKVSNHAAQRIAEEMNKPTDLRWIQ